MIMRLYRRLIYGWYGRGWTVYGEVNGHPFVVTDSESAKSCWKRAYGLCRELSRKEPYPAPIGGGWNWDIITNEW